MGVSLSDVRRPILAALTLVVSLVPASAPSAEPPVSAAGMRNCAPPSETFFTSLKVRGVTCANARTVITKAECVDRQCRDTAYGAWRCHTEGGIAFRTTRCRKGMKRIVATASGD